MSFLGFEVSRLFQMLDSHFNITYDNYKHFFSKIYEKDQ